MLTKFLNNMDIIAALDDEPNDVGGLTAAELKAKFDEGGKALQTYINETLIPALDGEAAMPHSHHNRAALDLISAVTTVMGASDTAVPTERAVSDAIMGLDHGQMFAHTHPVTDIVSGALPVERGGTGCDSVDEEPAANSNKMVKSGGVYSAMAALARLTCGSYVGTGTYGDSNPNNLTFDFEPKLLIVKRTSNDDSGYQELMAPRSVTKVRNSFSSGTNSDYYDTLSWSGNTVSWWAHSAAGQFNSSGTIYRYIAIG